MGITCARETVLLGMVKQRSGTCSAVRLYGSECGLNIAAAFVVFGCLAPVVHVIKIQPDVKGGASNFVPFVARSMRVWNVCPFNRPAQVYKCFDIRGQAPASQAE